MYKVLPVLALSLLTIACVPHDPDEETFIQTETYWEPVKVEKQEPKPVYVQPAPQQVPVKTVVVQQQPTPKETWWHKNHQKHVVKVVAPTCPCKDPNDPCTHCYQK